MTLQAGDKLMSLTDVSEMLGIPVRASLDHLDPALLRTLEIGDTIPDGPPGTAEFVVVEVDAPHALVLRMRWCCARRHICHWLGERSSAPRSIGCGASGSPNCPAAERR